MILVKIEYNTNISDWILRIALFFSVFAFASYNNNIQSAAQKSTQTELVLSSSTKKTTKVFSFEKSLNELIIANYPVPVVYRQQHSQLDYNQCIQVKLKVLINKVLAYKSSCVFVLNRIILSNSEEHINAI